MNIYTVRNNLKNTIVSKEEHLAKLIPNAQEAVTPFVADRIAIKTAIQYLSVNIGELKRILQDVEQCCKKATDQSWEANPDSMGGASTADEFAKSTAWR